jgi:riboflavin kinase/FMN adenylyltransferase
MYAGMLNIGCRPTFGTDGNGKNNRQIEVHIIDYKGNLYRKNIEVFFVKKIRNERKFINDNLLSIQLIKDRQTAQKILCRN